MESDLQQRNVNFVRELSSRAHFKDDFMLIKNWIGTMPLKCIVFLLQGGVIICRGRRYDFFAPLLKQKTSNFRETIHFRDIVPIQFLIKLRLSLKWALGESSQTKFTFLCRWPSWMLVPDVKCTLVSDQHLGVFSCLGSHWLNSGCFGPSVSFAYRALQLLQD